MKIYYRLIKIMLAIIIFSIMVTVTMGYGGYGDSGGTRVITASNIDPYSNIAKYETIERNLIANKSVEYPFTTPEFSIYTILVNSKINEYDIPLRIEDLKNTSEYGNGLVKPAPGIVYRNENIWLGSTRIQYITVKFRVENAWILDNGLDNDRLPYLLKYNGTAWSVLKTDITGKDDKYTYFESPKAGNSRIGIFAISAPLRRINITNNTVNMASKNIIPVKTEQYEEVTPIIEEVGVKKGMMGSEVIIVIIGVIMLVAYATRKKM